MLWAPTFRKGPAISRYQTSSWDQVQLWPPAIPLEVTAAPNLDAWQVERWVRLGLEHGDLLVIATDAANFDAISDLETVRDAADRLIIADSDPSTNFVRRLNHILDIALSHRAHGLIYQSVEIDVRSYQIETLKDHLDEDTLVVGAKIVDDHGSAPGVVPLSGWDCPWNTLALWNPQKLGVIGFSPISGGLLADLPRGAEEVAVISLLQKLFSKSYQAKLVDEW
jgi:hypothetical protein